MPNSTLPIFELGKDFFDPVQAGSFSLPKLRYKNLDIAKKLNLSALSDEQWIKHFCEFIPLENNLEQPLALRYHGHQFQHYNPELGDGRGFLFAQFLQQQNLYELGTKGSGITPYSRRGDGRLTLKGAVREALCTAYLQFQSVNTSKTFSIIETGESLIRHDEPSPTRSSVLVRYSHGHIRIGSFQRALYFQNKENMDKLVDYSLKYFYSSMPAEAQGSIQEKLLLLATWRLADLVASYLIAGFVHGVLNTDNINISGESFDYGPYRFTPKFDPHFTAAYFDSEGLYCFGRQPAIFQWNLEQLKKCLVFANPDLSLDVATTFGKYFHFHLVRRFLRKLKLSPKNLLPSSAFYQYLHTTPNDEKNPWLRSSNKAECLDSLLNPDLQAEVLNSDEFRISETLLELFFQFLEGNTEILYEDAYFYITSQALETENTVTQKVTSLFAKQPSFEALAQHLKQYFQLSDSLPISNALKDYFSSPQPQTLLIDEVESLWAAIDQDDNWQPFYRKLSHLRDLNSIYCF